RKTIIETFARSKNQVLDGMDISFCAIDLKMQELKWSGAGNPLWYFTGGKLKELAGDNQSVGQSYQSRNFVTHTLQLNKGDTLFLFTDGYADQFGGPTGKKFMSKRLKELLEANAEKPMAEICECVDSTFKTWKGELDQVDDVTIIGVRI